MCLFSQENFPYILSAHTYALLFKRTPPSFLCSTYQISHILVYVCQEKSTNQLVFLDLTNKVDHFLSWSTQLNSTTLHAVVEVAMNHPCVRPLTESLVYSNAQTNRMQKLLFHAYERGMQRVRSKGAQVSDPLVCVVKGRMLTRIAFSGVLNRLQRGVWLSRLARFVC